MPRTAPLWMYESTQERRARDLLEYDALVSTASEALSTGNPVDRLNVQRAMRLRAQRKQREEIDAERKRRIGERARQILQQRQQQESERRQSGAERFLSAAADVAGDVAGAGASAFRRAVPQGVRDVGGRAAQDTLHGMTSGGEFFGTGLERLTMGRVTGGDVADRLQLDRLPGPARTVLDVGTAPASLAAASPGAATAARSLIGSGSRAARGAGRVIEPLVSGGTGRRLAAETGFGTAGELTAEEAMERLPADTPGLVRALVGLGAGVAGGGAALGAARGATRVGQAVEETALRSRLADPSMTTTRDLGRGVRATEQRAATGITERARELLAARAARRRAAGRLPAGGADEQVGTYEPEGRGPEVRPGSGDVLPVQGGMEGMGAPDVLRRRREGEQGMQQLDLGIGAGERPIEDLPLFREDPGPSRMEEPPAEPPATENSQPQRGAVVGQRHAIESDFVDTDALPSIDVLDSRIRQVEGELTFDESGTRVKRSANRGRLRQLGELRAARTIREQVEAGGDQFDWMEGIERELMRVQRSIETRTDPDLGRPRRVTQAARRQGRTDLRDRTMRPEGGMVEGDLDILRAEADALEDFLGSARLDERGIDPNPAMRRQFAERVGIDPAAVRDPEMPRRARSRFAREQEMSAQADREQRRGQAERTLQMARDLGADVGPDLEEAVLRGRKGAARSLASVINQARRRQGRIRGGPEGITRPHEPGPLSEVEGANTQRRAGQLLREMQGRAREAGTPEAQWATADDAVLLVRAEEAGVRLTEAQQRRRDAGRRLAAGQREALLRAIARAEQAAGEAADAARAGDPLSGPGAGSAEPPAPSQTGVVPVDERFESFGDGPPDQVGPPRLPPGAPPGGWGDAAGGGGTGGAPDRGTSGIDDALAREERVLLRPGRVSEAVDETLARGTAQGGAVARAAEIAKPIIRGAELLLNPSRALDRELHVAYNARNDVQVMLASTMKADVGAALRNIEAAWDASPPRYVGPADNAAAGTVKDLGDHPDYYADVSPELRAAMGAYRDVGLRWLETLRAQYDIDVLPYRPESNHPDFVYFPTVNVHEDIVAALHRSPESLAGSGRTRRRLHEGAYERQKAAERGAKPFEAETDARMLADTWAEGMARAAGNNTFKRGAGGLTKPEAIDRSNPGLRQRKERAANRVAALNRRMQTAMREGREAATETRRTAADLSRTEKRVAPLLERLAELGDEYGTEFARLSGQMQEIGRSWRETRARLVAQGEKVRDIEARHQGFQQEYVEVARELDRLRAAYEAADVVIDGEPWVINRRTFRYHPAPVSRQIDRLIPADPVDNAFTRAMDEWRALVLNLDLSIATIHGSLALAMDPFTMRRGAEAMWRVGRDREAMLRIARDEAEDVADFTFDTGFEWPLRGSERAAEYREQRLLDRVPVVGRPVGERMRAFNEGAWRAVVYRVFEQYKADRTLLMERGLPKDVAGREAAETLSKVVPRLNPVRTGKDPARAQLERTVLISPSFLYGPATLVKDAASGLAKLGMAQQAGREGAWHAAMSGREQLAIQRLGLLMGTVAAISGSTAFVGAEAEGQDPGEALFGRDGVWNPTSGRFASLVIPTVGTVSLGGPIRSFLRAFAPRRNGEGGWDYLGGVWSFLQGKQHPALRALLDQVKGEDYFGTPIEEGVFNSRLANRLLYLGESASPIFVQEALGGARLNKGELLRDPGVGREVLLNMASQVAGQNLYQRRPIEVMNRAARSRFGEDFYDLPRIQQQQLKEAHPGLWERVVRAGGEPRQVAEELKEQLSLQQSQDDLALLTGRIGRDEWVAQMRDRRGELQAKLEHIYRDLPDRKPRNAFERYMQQFDVLEGKHGSMTDEAWDELDRWMAGQTAEDRAYIEENTGVDRTPLARVYRQVARIRSRLYELPKYRGFTAEQARDIDDLWQEVRNHAPSTDRGHMIRAYRMVVGDRDDAVARGVKKRIVGTLRRTKHREEYRGQHPEIDLFFGAGRLTEREAAVLASVVARERRRFEREAA